MNSDADREALKETLIQEQITWRSWWDEGSVNGPIQTEWQVMLRPTIYVLDANGIVRFKNVTEELLDKAVDSLLAELD